MQSPVILNENDFSLLCSLLFFLSAFFLWAIARTMFGNTAVSARWVGRRIINKSKQAGKACQLLELSLPDGSTAIATCLTTRALSEQLREGSGYLSAVNVSRTTPGIIKPIQPGNALLKKWACVIIPVLTANYLLACYFSYDMPVTVYAIEAGTIVLALVYAVINGARANGISWEAYRAHLASHEQKLTTSVGPIDNAATAFDPDRVDADTLGQTADVNTKRWSRLLAMLVMLGLFCVTLPSLKAYFISYPSRASAHVTSTKISDNLSSICYFTVEFEAPDAPMTVYAPPGQHAGTPTVTVRLKADHFSPYCRVGANPTVMYDPRDVLHGKVMIDTHGWALYGTLLQLFYLGGGILLLLRGWNRDTARSR